MNAPNYSRFGSGIQTHAEREADEAARRLFVSVARLLEA